MTQVHPERSPVIDDEILTTDEVCALLKMSKQTLYKRTSNGTGPALLPCRPAQQVEAK